MSNTTDEVWDIGRLKLNLRRLEPSDMGQLWMLIAHECWPISLDELRVVHRVAPNDFLGVFSDDGALISHIHVLLLNELYCHLTLYITSKPYRGRGIGRRLFEYAEKVVGSRTISLDAVGGMENTYELSGFKVRDVEIRWIEGTLNKTHLAENTSDDPTIVINQLTSKDMQGVCVYDKSISGCDRGEFMKLFYVCPKNEALVAKDPVTNETRGYLILREEFMICQGGATYQCVGFYADTASIAVQLLRTMFLNRLPSDVTFWFRYPTTNKNPSLFQILGEVHENEARRKQKMTYGGSLPPFDWQKVYGVANANIGFGYI